MSLRVVSVLVALALSPSVAPAMPDLGCPHHAGMGTHAAHGANDAEAAPAHHGDHSRTHAAGHGPAPGPTPGPAPPCEHGEWMLSYRFLRMSMAGNRDGTDRLETSDVHRDFMVAPLDMTMTMHMAGIMVAPLDMTMTMHMAGIMYAPTDMVTLMVMANWIDQSMNHETRPGGWPLCVWERTAGDTRRATRPREPPGSP